MMTVRKTSMFPASEKEVFKRLQRLKTLQYIAYPNPMAMTISQRLILSMGITDWFGKKEQHLPISSGCLQLFRLVFIQLKSFILDCRTGYIQMKAIHTFLFGIIK